MEATLRAYRRPTHVKHLFWYDTQASRVTWVGDPNGWDPSATSYQRNGGGWRLSLELPHGRYRYLVMVDGQPQLDPHSDGTVKDEEGSSFSLLEVS